MNKMDPKNSKKPERRQTEYGPSPGGPSPKKVFLQGTTLTGRFCRHFRVLLQSTTPQGASGTWTWPPPCGDNVRGPLGG